MADPKQFAELVKQAEQSVKAVSDPELRRVAFEKILSALLEAPGFEKDSLQDKSPQSASSSRTRKKTSKKLKGPKTYVRELYDDGFFSKPKTISQVKAELENRGHHISVTGLSGPLQSLCKDKVLRREKTVAPSKGGKERHTFTYSKW